MKRILIITLLLSSLTLTAQTPCEDTIYLRLKHTSIDSLTERQYNYMIEKEKACNEYLNEAARIDKQAQQVNSYLIAVIVIGLLASLPILLLTP